MDLGIKGKRALVTGASVGIGREVAMTLAREGVDVAICSRGENSLKATTADIKALGVNAIGIKCDCTVPEQVQNLVHKAVTELGGLDILVNSIGEAAAGNFLELTEQQWHDSIEGKFLGQIRVTKAVIPYMKDQKWGRIIHIIGNAGVEPGPFNLPPATSNAALINFVKGLSRDLAKNGILINGVSPGATDTRRIAYLIERQSEIRGLTPEEMRARFVKDIPVGRIGSPQEIADMVVFLSSKRASFITGEVIIVDGGERRGV